MVAVRLTVGLRRAVGAFTVPLVAAAAVAVMLPAAALAAQPGLQSRTTPARARRDTGSPFLPDRESQRPGAGAVTATALAETGGAPGGSVMLTATVTDTANAKDDLVAAGTVTFYRDGASRPLGTVSSGSRPSAGVYSLPVRFTTDGPESVVAVYAPPARSRPYRSSRSAVVSFAVQACPTCRGVQTTADIVPAGMLSIATPYTAGEPFDLGTLTLNPAGTFYSASAPLDPAGSDVPTEGAGPADPTFNGITIVDTQTSNSPWNVTAWASELSNGGDSALSVISGEDVGLSGLTAVAVPGDPLTAGDVTLFDGPAASPPVAATDTGSLGLGGPAPHEIVSDAGQAGGTIGINGTITVNAPSSTQAGTFSGIIVFTLSN
jgi:hypothetical protein